MSFQSRPIFDDDDSFWEQYNSLNDAYKAQLRPYLFYNYSPSGWDSFRSWAFGRSNDDAMREQAQAKAWEQLGILQNDVFQNDLNSIQSQVSRERNAGLNPDLTGDVHGELAAGQEQPMNPPIIDFLTPPSSLTEDLGQVIMGAASVLSAGGAFRSALASAGLSSAQENLIGIQKESILEDIAGKQISNYQTAHDAVKSYLREISPEDWQTILDHTKDGPLLKPDLLRAHFDKFFKDSPASSKKYLNTAFDNLLQSPSLVNDYYTNRGKASSSRVDALSAEKAFGSFDIALPFVQAQNRELISWNKDSFMLQAQYHRTFLEYQNALTGNGLTLEQFRTKYKVPEQQAKGEELSFIASQFTARQEKRRMVAEQKLLKKYEDLSKSPDKAVADAATYYLNQLLVRSAAQLMNNSAKAGIGPFSVGQSISGPLSLSPSKSSSFNDPTAGMMAD